MTARGPQHRGACTRTKRALFRFILIGDFFRPGRDVTVAAVHVDDDALPRAVRFARSRT